MPAGDEPTGAHIDFLIEKSPVTSLPIQRGRISSWVSCLSSISAIVTPCADGHDRLPKMAAPPRRRYRNAAFDPGGDCGADVSRGPHFLENNPIQSSLWVRFMCPKTRRNWLRLPNCPVAQAKPHPRRRPPPFPRDSCVSWHTVNLRSAHLAPIIRTSEHFHVFSPPPRLSVRMFGSGGKKRAMRPRIAPPRNRVARHPLAWSDERRPDGSRSALL
jgi:hypothetical protein